MLDEFIEEVQLISRADDMVDRVLRIPRHCRGAHLPPERTLDAPACPRYGAGLAFTDEDGNYKAGYRRKLTLRGHQRRAKLRGRRERKAGLGTLERGPHRQGAQPRTGDVLRRRRAGRHRCPDRHGAGSRVASDGEDRAARRCIGTATSAQVWNEKPVPRSTVPRSMRSLNALKSLPRPRMSVDNGSIATKKGYRHEALPCDHTDRKLR